jgi:hypothetical protein
VRRDARVKHDIIGQRNGEIDRRVLCNATLAVNGARGANVEFAMVGNDQGLLLSGSIDASQFDVTSALGEAYKPEVSEDRDDLDC